MSNRFVSIFLLFLFLISLFSVLTPATQEAFSQNSKPSIAWWSKTYERPYADRAWSVIQTVDGGYAIVGETERSFGTGESDYWLIKTDADWNVQWNRTYGGTGRYNQSRGHRIVQTRDGGYAIVGVTDCFGVEGTDYWLVRTDENGKMQYNRTYGGPGYDRPFSLIQTTDGGYGIAGKWGAVLAESEYDMGVVKTDADGNLQWIKIYGGPNFDTGLSMLQTRDGGYAIVGETESFGAGDRDFWLVKTDVNGNMQWNRTYGGPSSEIPWSIVQTKGGGYAIGGYTRSFGAGAEDFWLVRTDVNGNMLWNKTYGGMNLDWQYSMVQTWDGGYAIAGYTSSFGAGDQDFWLVKTDSDGNMQWSEAFGGTNREQAFSVIQTMEGGYAMVGSVTFHTPPPEGRLMQDFLLVVIPHPPQWPVPDFNYLPSKLGGSLSVTLNASASYDLNGTIISHIWDFGDANITAASAPIMIHTYTMEGDYTITLNITNNFGLWSTSSTRISTLFISDLNRDCCVNILDISIVAVAHGSIEGDSRYNVLADLDKNGVVNILDVTMVAKDYGKTV